MQQGVFEKDWLESNREPVRHARMEPIQEQLVDDMVSIISPAIHMEVFPCKGFFLKSMKQWQDDHGQLISNIAHKRPEERVVAATQIKNLLKQVLQVLRDPEDADILEKALDDAFHLYLSKYAGRLD